MAEHADSIAFLIALVGGYLIGSVPFGLLLTKAAGLGDIRQVGSGNIGATNVLRTGRKGLAAATLILDGLKGAVAVLLARYFLGDQDVVAARRRCWAIFSRSGLAFAVARVWRQGLACCSPLHGLLGWPAAPCGWWQRNS